MDLGCFHKYIAFYAYINCCKTNSSLKRGNEKVAISNINTIISNDIQKVWNIVLAVDKYNSWRSDLSKTEIINDKQFIENIESMGDIGNRDTSCRREGMGKRKFPSGGL